MAAPRPHHRHRSLVDVARLREEADAIDARICATVARGKRDDVGLAYDLARMNERRRWSVYGCADVVAYAALREVDLDPSKVRQMVAMVRVLETEEARPLRELFETGEVGWTKVREAARQIGKIPVETLVDDVRTLSFHALRRKLRRQDRRDPEATNAAFAGGWFHTGDIGVMDDDGYVYIVDRLKDMIVSGGENIASSEIERVLYEHESVVEVAVVGRPDDRWGEVPVAYVVVSSTTATTPEELVEHCRGQLARFKVPKEVVVIDALPRNPSGKVLKRELRDRG